MQCKPATQTPELCNGVDALDEKLGGCSLIAVPLCIFATLTPHQQGQSQPDNLPELVWHAARNLLGSASNLVNDKGYREYTAGA